tara:strand:- start:3036 stop:3986 length:951 start_codon:yes stop_codon:yes gene_type:complete
VIYKHYLKKLFFVSIFFLVFNFSKAYTDNQITIVAKINNEIVTNIDVEKETRYLLALNPGLRTISKDKLKKIAKKSIIKEKIKKIEVSKFFEIDKQNEYFGQVFRDFYIGLNINSEKDLEKYLSEYKLKVDDVKKKINIETLWNELIYLKFKNQIDIDEVKMKKKLKKKLSKDETQQSYLLYEIIFSSENKDDLKKKHEIIKKSINEIGFQKTANIYSESDSSTRDGKIGWINESQLSGLIKKELTEIKIGEYTNLISVTGGSLILTIKDKKNIKNNLNFEEEFKKTLSFERNRQLNQFSTIYFSKIKNNVNIYEK